MTTIVTKYLSIAFIDILKIKGSVPNKSLPLKVNENGKIL